jgi:nicotinate-nucleotide adenylyltransferase
MPRRLGIFGGSFNPVHQGHLVMAECCREQAGLDRVLFVPAATPPHKQAADLAPCDVRLEMLRLAVGGHPGFDVLPDECERGGISYTIDTVSSLRQRFPEDDLLLILGADALASLPTGREPRQLLKQIRPIALIRQGVDDLEALLAQPALGQLFAAEQADRLRADQVQVPAIDIRASHLRKAVAAGRSIRFRTPRAVECLIHSRRLYRAPSPSPQPLSEQPTDRN